MRCNFKRKKETKPIKIEIVFMISDSKALCPGAVQGINIDHITEIKWDIYLWTWPIDKTVSKCKYKNYCKMCLMIYIYKTECLCVCPSQILRLGPKDLCGASRRLAP